MTALFVFVEGPVAFIASDTKRGGTYGFPPTLATKTRRWSERVLIGQTGDGEGLDRLVGEMASWQHRDPQFSTANGVELAFDKSSKFRLEYERYQRMQFAKSIGGTLVVAEAEYGPHPASIRTIDWVTGQKVPHPCPIYADGTAPSAFAGIGSTQYGQYRPGGAGPFDLAAWGLACIASAIGSLGAGGPVDWPADLTITRRDGASFITLTQRVIGPTAKTNPLFCI